jgi:AraC-like DNA-binding protein
MKAVHLWTPVDPLGEALHFLRMSGTFYSRGEFTAPWGIELPEMPGSLMFHFVTSGRCWMQVDGAKRQLLQHGDLVLVPHGQGHRLLSQPNATAARLFDLPREELRERYEIIRHGGGGGATTMICGAVRFDHPAAQHLIKLLPRSIHIAASSSPHLEWVNTLLRFMAAEASALRPGGEAVITRLADILVIQTLRAWITQEPAATVGWLGALKDRQLGRALSLIHRDPARPWTLETLAADAGMSRSAFAARFAELVGETPMHYVARWRMQVALTWLREDDMTLADMAGRLGYQSEAAFSRAFKRCMHVSPGEIRREAREGNMPVRESPRRANRRFGTRQRLVSAMQA